LIINYFFHTEQKFQIFKKILHSGRAANLLGIEQLVYSQTFVFPRRRRVIFFAVFDLRIIL